MDRAPSLESFADKPIGRWLLTSPTTLVFSASPELVGAVAWGAPQCGDVEAMLAAFLAYRCPRVAPSFDVLLDARSIDGVDPEAFTVLLGWLREHREEIAGRVRIQYGVISDDTVGVLLSGILPTLGETHAFRVVRDRRDALRALSASGDQVCDELDAIVASVRGTPRELRDLRAHLRRHSSSGTTIEACARALAVSVRSLQRVLHETGTSFREEIQDVRFADAENLLRNTTDKVAIVARRVGLSENALADLVRKKTGFTPGELRRRHRPRITK